MIGSLFLTFNSWLVRIESDLTCQVCSYLSYLIVSCHQVLNCLSIYGGYLLNICALLLMSARMHGQSYRTAFTKTNPGAHWMSSTWSVGSWATMMCSCPRACSLSGVIAVWCACRAVRHANQKLDSSVTFPGFCAADIFLECLPKSN